MQPHSARLPLSDPRQARSIGPPVATLAVTGRTKATRVARTKDLFIICLVAGLRDIPSPVIFCARYCQVQEYFSRENRGLAASARKRNGSGCSRRGPQDTVGDAVAPGFGASIASMSCRCIRATTAPFGCSLSGRFGSGSTAPSACWQRQHRVARCSVNRCLSCRPRATRHRQTPPSAKTGTKFVSPRISASVSPTVTLPHPPSAPRITASRPPFRRLYAAP